MANYSELLKDPRWQRLRLQIMQRDSFCCQKCGRNDKTLHVHHQYYIKGHDPWDYHPTLLVTLCFECHEEEEYAKGQTEEFVQYMLMNQLLRHDIHRLLSHVACIVGELASYPASPQVHRDKLNEIIDFIDKQFSRDRSVKTPQPDSEQVNG